MNTNRTVVVSSLCLGAILLTLGACATGQDLRETSRKFEDQTETVRTSLESKIEQLKQTQREAEKTLAKLEHLIDDNKREQSQTRELAAKLNSDLRSFREMDLTKVEGRVERAKRDIEALQGRVEDQVSSLQQNAQQWLAILDQKQTAKLDQQVVRVDQQVAKVEGRMETLDKREVAASTRIQETLTTLGKKIDERLDVQDRRIEGRIKKVEDEGRTLATHLTDVDKSLAQMADTVRTVAGKLSTQLEQHGGSLAKLEEATKQADAQIRTLTPRVDQLKTSFGDLAKVLHTLTEKSAEIDRRVTDVAGQTEGKEQGAKIEARVEALNRSLAATMTSVNDTTRALADLKQVLEVSVGKLASRVDEQGDVLNKLAQQLQIPGTASTASSEAATQAETPVSGTAKPSAEAGGSPESAYEHAYQEFQQNQYENALASFRNFLSHYPDSTLVPNAHFWIAECYVKKRDYQKSLSAYEQVIRYHPRSGKASIALYRKALVLLELKDKMAARTALKKLITDYPKSEESKQARTKLATLQ